VHVAIGAIVRPVPGVEIAPGRAAVARLVETALFDAKIAHVRVGGMEGQRLGVPEMRRRRHGTIINIASLAGRNGFVGGTAYTASKHAVLGFSRSLMLEVRRDNVRVVAICPGSVGTAMLQDQPLLKADPAKILRPEDVAATILHTLELPERALVSELDIRPTNP